MDAFSRRQMLAATAAGGLLTTVAIAQAQSTDAVPQPQRPGRGGADHGPRNLMRDQENPDLLVPPSTDSGTLPNLRFSFSDAHMRLETGGWTRQVTTRELGVAKEMAGVNMRLNAGGVRELHWHKASEWAYLLYGSARITAMDYDGTKMNQDGMAFQATSDTSVMARSAIGRCVRASSFVSVSGRSAAYCSLNLSG
jgi:oxalate decarboxylase